MSEKMFAFDVGTGSLGIAVRHGDRILESRSLLIPQDFASTKEQRERRRQWRTRLSHQAREKWLNRQCRYAGIEVLNARNPAVPLSLNLPCESQRPLSFPAYQEQNPGDETGQY